MVYIYILHHGKWRNQCCLSLTNTGDNKSRYFDHCCFNQILMSPPTSWKWNAKSLQYPFHHCILLEETKGIAHHFDIIRPITPQNVIINNH